MHPEAVSGHFYIYLGLGLYGHGVCLYSLHLWLTSEADFEAARAGPEVDMSMNDLCDLPSGDPGLAMTLMRVQTHTMTICTEAQIDQQMLQHGLRMHLPSANNT